jgi:hypothetical protein
MMIAAQNAAIRKFDSDSSSGRHLGCFVDYPYIIRGPQCPENPLCASLRSVLLTS